MAQRLLQAEVARVREEGPSIGVAQQVLSHSHTITQWSHSFTCWGRKVTSSTLSGLSSMVSVSHLSTTLSCSPPSAPTRAACAFVIGDAVG